MKIVLSMFLVLAVARILLFILDKFGNKAGIDGPSPKNYTDDGIVWFY